MDHTRLTLIEAIARKLTVAARYNGSDIRLAPHVLFQRHGDLFVSALNLSRNRIDEEARLGQFKLTGLAATTLLDETFEAIPTYRATVPRAEDVLILAV